MFNNNEYGQTSLFFVQNADEIDELLMQGCCLDAIDKHGFHAIFHSRNIGVLRRFIELGVSVDIRQRLGRASLIHVLNDADMVRCCIDNGINLESVDINGNTALHVVRKKQVADVLIECGANVRAYNKCGRMPIHCARKRSVFNVLMISDPENPCILASMRAQLRFCAFVHLMQ